MDEIKRITKNELYEIASTKRFTKELLAKDYVLTEMLFLLRNIPNVYFKGGTALQKTILHHSRLSEDIDFIPGSILSTAGSETPCRNLPAPSGKAKYS